MHGEACHSLSGAWTQARERYASVIAELGPEVAARGVVRLLDVGTGLGFNLAAALEACEARGLALDATSFELEPEVPRAAVRMARETACVSPEHRRVLDWLESELEREGAGTRPAAAAFGASHRAQLVLGDALVTLPRLGAEQRFDAVFLDPFSPRVDPPLWQEEFLREVARRMDRGARLSTYTTSLAVRVRLARAGLDVGAGPRVGEKAQGTLAARGGPVPPLDARTKRKLAARLQSGEK
ncbi:MAG TPA: MnmC family methyltransferase [Planctomycetota bacterium]|nr:MnmC family methyltransferase [Planctomycetota bacterium]